MFDIQELSSMVFQRLSLDDMTNCARVNRKWYGITIPYLWADLTLWPAEAKRSFRRMVVEDYLQEKGHGEAQDEERLDYPLSALAKYSPWIRLLPDSNVIARYLTLPVNEKHPAADELFLHLLKRCPAATIRSLFIHQAFIEQNPTWKAIVDAALPIRANSTSTKTT